MLYSVYYDEYADDNIPKLIYTNLSTKKLFHDFKSSNLNVAEHDKGNRVSEQQDAQSEDLDNRTQSSTSSTRLLVLGIIVIRNFSLY
jgi:hypothetical protein